MPAFRVRAPGRVNLIGDHTDYTGGLVLPMTIDRWTVIDGEAHDGPIELHSDAEPVPALVPLPVDDPATVEPPWARYVAGVAAELGPRTAPFRGRVTTDIPIGAGLSSSAALEVAAALAMGFEGDALSLARLCQRAEHRASGVPCGIMDQLCIAAGVDGHALLIDCHALSVEPVELPDDVAVTVEFVAHRPLVGSEYAARVGECAAAEGIIGPLRLAGVDDVERISDDVLARRARHVITENQRVRDFVAALHSHDLARAGELMVASHQSLRDDFETSTPAMDAAVESAISAAGVHGARMTGGGFGGCVVVLADPDATIGADSDNVWRVRAVSGASRSDADDNRYHEEEPR